MTLVFSYYDKGLLQFHIPLWWLLLLLFSRSVISNSLWPMDCSTPGLPIQPTPRVYSNPCPSNLWCHPPISSSVVPFSSCLQSFPTSGSFLMSQFFTSGGQSIGVSASASVLPMNIQDWYFRMDWLGLLAVQGTLKSLLQTPQFKSISSSTLSLLCSPTLISIHEYWKNHSFD